MDVKKVGAQIQKARKNAGLTQDSLAQAVGLSTKYVSNLECGAKTAKLDTFVLIANALHTDANTLLADVLDCHTEITTTKISKHLEHLSCAEQDKVLKIVDILAESSELTK